MLQITNVRSFEKGLADRGGWREEILHMPEIQWAEPGVLWKKAPRAIRAMRGKTLQTVPFKGISTVLWVHQKLPQSTVSQAFPSNKSYESKAGCNRTPATVLWVPLIQASFLYPFSYAPLGEGGHNSGDLFGLFLGVRLSPTPSRQPLFETSENGKSLVI